MSDETQHIFQEEAPLMLSIQLIVFLLKIDRWNYLFTTWAKPNLIYDDKCLTKTVFFFLILDWYGHFLQLLYGQQLLFSKQ